MWTLISTKRFIKLYGTYRNWDGTIGRFFI